MDRELAIELMSLLPEGATNIIIKGREASEVFFTMPKDWRPSDDQGYITLAPQAIQYYDKDRKDGVKPKGRRWRMTRPQ